MTTTVLGTLAASGYGMHSGSGWWMGGMMIWMGFFWIAVAVGIVWLIRIGVERRMHTVDHALQLLDRRFASGEVSLDEYRARKSVLEGERFDGTSPNPQTTTGKGAGT